METIKYPVGMQSFPEIREKGFVFVDKSQYIEKLHALGKYFFLSRPRRFGKSLFLSMLKAYYEGKKELFAGLAADSGNHDWQSFPVLHLDFTGRDYTDPDSLNSRLRTILDMVVYMPNYIYVFEFKRNGTPEEALRQIDDKEYMIPFKCDGRKLIKIGANFDDAIKGLDNWKIQA